MIHRSKNVHANLRAKGDQPIQPDGRLHTGVYCPECGSEMTELEFNRKNSEVGYIWESFRKCPKCGAKVEW